MKEDAGPSLLSDSELDTLELLFYVPKEQHWWTAAEIARGGRGKLPEGAKLNLSKDTAGKAAKKLVELGIASAKDVLAPRKGTPSPHYYLAEEPEDVARALAFYLNRILKDGDLGRAYRFLKSPYAHRCLTSDFVRYVLIGRGTQLLVKLPVSAFKFILYDDEGRGKTVPTPTEVPVCPPKTRPPDAIRQMVEHFRPMTLVPDRALVQTTLARHYGFDEEQLVVVPLLALISVSPQALIAFLSPWEPHAQIKDRVRGLIHGRIEHVFFSTIYGALYDVASTRAVPGSLVQSAEGTPREDRSFEEGATLLALRLYTGHVIRYAAGFNAPIMAMPSPHGLVRVSHNPADGWARVAWVDPPARDEGDDVDQDGDSREPHESV